MYRGKIVSVVISTYREKNSIKSFINECFETGFVDEVIVVNNNAEEGTDEEVKNTRAKLFYEYEQGYGAGYMKGISLASGELIIMTEADGTFSPHDFEKLLLFSVDFPVIFCTRTANHAIIDGANMGHFLKWGNYAVAKMIELFYMTTQISDVGCTMRLFRRDIIMALLPTFKVKGSHFGLEMVLMIVKKRIPFIEIPISYYPRIGESAVTGNFRKTLVLGFTMIFFLFKKRMTG